MLTFVQMTTKTLGWRCRAALETIQESGKQYEPDSAPKPAKPSKEVRREWCCARQSE